MKKRLFKKLLLIISGCAASLLIVTGAICFHVISSTRGMIKTPDEAVLFDAECIMVLGAKVRYGEPSLMLRDRLDKGLELHEDNAVPLLMSGDCSGEDYDEVSVMKSYAVENGALEANVSTDPEGYSTFESVTRLKNNFGIEKAIIVTQRYHLPRALYIAKKAGLEAVGVAAEDILYYGHTKRLIREAAAQVKDFLWCLFI